MHAVGFLIAGLGEKPGEQEDGEQLHPQRDGRDEAFETAAAGGFAAGLFQQEEGGDGEFFGLALEKMDRQHGGDAEQREQAKGICEGDQWKRLDRMTESLSREDRLVEVIQ